MAISGRAGFVILATLALMFLASSVMADQQIGKMTVKDGSATFHRNGQLERAVLAKEFPYIRGIVCAEHNEITVHPNGNLSSCVLKNKLTLSNSPDVVFVFRAGKPINMDVRGSIVSGIVENGTRIRNLPVKAGESLTLNGTGNLESFVLASNYKLGQITWKQNTVIAFHTNGNVAMGTPAQDFRMPNGFIFKAGQQYRFDPSGNIAP